MADSWLPFKTDKEKHMVDLLSSVQCSDIHRAVIHAADCLTYMVVKP